MWKVELDADVAYETNANNKPGIPRSCRVSGQAATKADVYKLVDRLCESLGIPDD